LKNMWILGLFVNLITLILFNKPSNTAQPLLH